MRVLAIALMLTLTATLVDAGWTAPPAAIHEPRLLFSVSDDTLEVPFGAIVDATVGRDGTVYLLDKQVMAVRRIDPAGHVLPSVGRQGEGPAEFTMPRAVAVYADGRCLVLQDFYMPTICLEPGGKPCEGPDLNRLKTQYLLFLFSRVQIDARGRLVVGLIVTPRAESERDALLDELNPQMLIARSGVEAGDSYTVLFTSSSGEAGSDVVILPASSQPFVAQGWDISPGGTIIYCDPDGSYGVVIGHPVDGDSRRIVLPSRKSDREDLKRALEDVGVDMDVEEARRILRIGWLDDEHFLVEPTTAVTTPNPGVVGTFEVFGRDGNSYGLHTVHVDYDPSQDALYFRWDKLVVVRGAQSAMRASFAALGNPAPSEAASPPRDDIRIDVYKLFGELRRPRRVR